MLSRTPRAFSALRPSFRIVRNSPGAIQLQFQPRNSRQSLQQLPRSFHSTPTSHKGIQPDSAEPQAPKEWRPPKSVAAHVVEASPLSNEQFHEYSEHYLNVLFAELEKLQEEGSDIEPEYSAGVMSIDVPGVGTYVLNKQPPNKQIWISSPISGPKRYDWVLQGDGMQAKQETETQMPSGKWLYLRDGSDLTDLLCTELSITLPKDFYSIRDRD